MGLKGEAGPSPPAMEGDGDLIDFVLTLGGDGLLMYSNTLFQVIVYMEISIQRTKRIRLKLCLLCYYSNKM